MKVVDFQLLPKQCLPGCDFLKLFLYVSTATQSNITRHFKTEPHKVHFSSHKGLSLDCVSFLFWDTSAIFIRLALLKESRAPFWMEAKLQH